MLNFVLLRLLETYFRRKWLYLLPILLMVVAAVAYILLLQPKYVAKGVLYVQNQSFLASLTSVRANNPAWWITPAQATVNEINELMQTDAFVRAIIQQTDLEIYMSQGPEAVDNLLKETRKSIYASPLGENQVQITASFENPEVAYQLVNSVISGYTQWQINAQRGESEVAQVFFRDLIATYGIELNLARQEMKDYLEANPMPLRGDRPGGELIEISRLQSMIDLMSQRYANALEKEENTRLALAQVESDARQSNLLIDAPKLPERPEVSKRRLALQAGLFVIAGVIISISSVAGAAVLDRSFRFPIDVNNRLGLSVLTMIPDTEVKAKKSNKKSKKKERDESKAEEMVETYDSLPLNQNEPASEHTSIENMNEEKEEKETVW